MICLVRMSVKFVAQSCSPRWLPVAGWWWRWELTTAAVATSRRRREGRDCGIIIAELHCWLNSLPLTASLSFSCAILEAEESWRGYRFPPAFLPAFLSSLSYPCLPIMLFDTRSKVLGSIPCSMGYVCKCVFTVVEGKQMSRNVPVLKDRCLIVGMIS